ncbi:MAG: transcription antitermination protein NusB, partial [Alistipes sp.]|nr:transcription antitermination protein NusB [Alistipes sp.]
KALFAHLKSESDNMIASEKNLVATVDKAYDLYFQLLTLPEQLVKYAQERIDIAKQKKLPTFEDLHPNTKFVDNAVIRIISTTDAVADHVAKRKLGWTGQEDLIRLIYQQLIETEFFKTYMARDNRSWEEDRALVDYLFTMLNDCPVLDEALEEMSLMWADDLPYILAMIQRTISNMRISHTQLRVAEKYKSEEDPQFLKTLFEKALVNYNDYQSYVERFTANWDIERVVFMDNLILGVAIAELVAFPSIPVKVTMDEWIEISKYYSTPGSSTFINGVLDKIVALLTEEGKIQKSGRGLI